MVQAMIKIMIIIAVLLAMILGWIIYMDTSWEHDKAVSKANQELVFEALRQRALHEAEGLPSGNWNGVTIWSAEPKK
jgi:hypothetical protein